MSLAELAAPRTIGFTHRGEYSGEPTGRPIVTVEFAVTDSVGVLLGSYETGVMVDSGAQITVLEHEVALALGLDVRQFPLTFLEGAVPADRPDAEPPKLLCVEVDLLANLCGTWIEIPALFPFKAVPVRNVLGRAVVFDRVRFAFGGGELAVYGVA